MCPFCLTTIGLIVASAASTGGLAALVLSRKKSDAREIIPNRNEAETAIRPVFTEPGTN